jgi:hypothetical protein
MPCVSDFYGIAIYMYYSDHAPPHFHAEYAGDEVEIEISTLRILCGGLKRRALALVLEWASQHQGELLVNWNLARQGVPLPKIDGLP